MRAALLKLRFYRALLRVAYSAVEGQEKKIIERAKKIHGDGNAPGMSCGCGDCWLYWLQKRD